MHCQVLQSSNLFRSKYCYVETTDLALQRHSTTLRSVYERYHDTPSSAPTLQISSLSLCTCISPKLRACIHRYAELNTDVSDKLSHRRLLSCGEWVALVDHLGFLKTKEVCPRCSKL